MASASSFDSVRAHWALEDDNVRWTSAELDAEIDALAVRSQEVVPSIQLEEADGS